MTLVDPSTIRDRAPECGDVECPCGRHCDGSRVILGTPVCDECWYGPGLPARIEECEPVAQVIPLPTRPVRAQEWTRVLMPDGTLCSFPGRHSQAKARRMARGYC